MKIDFNRRMQGALTVVATITDEQINILQSHDRGRYADKSDGN